MTGRAGKPTCKDCGSATRKLSPPGPRCATCHRAHGKRQKAAQHDRMVCRVYGLPPGGYAALYAAQGGRCYICRRATGASRRLPVDHDHATGEVYGLLCGPCNKNVIGHLRRDVEALRRAIDYLTDPPARKVLRTS